MSVWFAVGNISSCDGYVTSRDEADAWPGRETGWTYQGVTGARGTVLYEGDDEAEARRILAPWLVCEDEHCYTHGEAGP